MLHSSLYNRAHIRVREVFGPASGYQCVLCPESAKEWAFSHLDKNAVVDENGKWAYSDEPAFYAPMCHRCHINYDVSNGSREEAPREKSVEPGTVELPERCCQREGCYKSLEGMRADAKFCNGYCRRAAGRPVKDRVCQAPVSMADGSIGLCGKSLEGKRKDAKTCSPSCRTKLMKVNRGSGSN